MRKNNTTLQLTHSTFVSYIPKLLASLYANILTKLNEKYFDCTFNHYIHMISFNLPNHFQALFTVYLARRKLIQFLWKQCVLYSEKQIFLSTTVKKFPLHKSISIIEQPINNPPDPKGFVKQIDFDDRWHIFEPAFAFLDYTALFAKKKNCEKLPFSFGMRGTDEKLLNQQTWKTFYGPRYKGQNVFFVGAT